MGSSLKSKGDQMISSCLDFPEFNGTLPLSVHLRVSIYPFRSYRNPLHADSLKLPRVQTTATVPMDILKKQKYRLQIPQPADKTDKLESDKVEEYVSTTK